MAKATKKKKEIKKFTEEKKAVKEEEKVEDKKKHDWQILVIIIIMVLAIAFVVAFSYIYKNAGNFTYKGFNFQKEKFDQLTIYRTKIALTTPQGTINYNLIFRNDPRYVEVPLNASIFLFKNTALVFQPEVGNCKESNLAAYNMAYLFGAMGINVSAGTTSKEVAEQRNVSRITCLDAVNQTVIIFKEDDVTAINQEGYCYIISVSDCRVVEASEKFMLESVYQIMSRAE